MGQQEETTDFRRDRFGSAAGLSVTVLLHAAAVYALLQHHPVNSAVTPPRPLMVAFVAAPQPPQVLPQAAAKPKRVEQRAVRHPQPRMQPTTPTPVIAAAAADPHVSAAAPSEPERPATTAPSANAVAAPSPAPVNAPALTQPSFNADYLQNPAPRYPPLARRMGQQGKVVLRVLVNPGGGPAQIEVRASSGSDVLDEAALDAVRRWRFVPAKRGDQPVAAWVLVPITFTLQG